jgi:flavin reductase (DIM6/NTAB) family NADH-FMN oxidoreductase RutF
MTACGVAESRRALRDVLGRYATGVTVITTRHQGRLFGLTANSFTSVSLDPPLVLWCLSRTSSSRAAFAQAGHFVVNVLAAGQDHLARRFAGPGDRFTRVALDDYRLPELADTAATLVCRRDRLVPAGDHLILLGEVVRHRAADRAPLLFVDGAYHRGPAG